eukprot:gene30054-39246_t
MAERRLFPSRDARATGWQIGLREEFGWDDNRNKDATPAVEEEDKNSPEYRQRQRNNFRHHIIKKAAIISMLKKDSIFAEVEHSKKAPILLEKLPTVTKEVKQKYFGLSSKQMFFETVFLNPMGVIDLWAAQEAGYAAEVAQAISKCSPTGPEKRDTLRPLTPILVLDSTPYMGSTRVSIFNNSSKKLFNDVSELGPVDSTFNQGSPSISQNTDLKVLDISQNKIDSDAASALADYIGSPDCLLDVLRMSVSDIDDGESLNLHWNMIRLKSADALCDSLRYNHTLTDLDLSYNAIGRSASNVRK